MSTYRCDQPRTQRDIFIQRGLSYSMLHAFTCLHNSIDFQTNNLIVLYVALMRIDLAMALQSLLQQLQSGLVGELAQERRVTFCSACQ